MQRVVLYTMLLEDGNRLQALLDEESFMPINEDLFLLDKKAFYHCWLECSEIGFSGLPVDESGGFYIVAWVDEYIKDGRLNTQILSSDESHSDQLYSKVEKSSKMLKDLNNILTLKIHDYRN